MNVIADTCIWSSALRHRSPDPYQCRAHGVQGAHTDFLICAVSVLDRMALFTTDGDFEHYKKHVSIRLYK